MREREHQHQQQHQQQHPGMGHLGDGYGGVVPNCFSPPKTFAHMAPYPQPINDSGYYGQGLTDSPYSINAKQSRYTCNTTAKARSRCRSRSLIPTYPRR